MIMNITLFAFIITDEHVPQTCLEGGYYHKHSELCYIQAGVARLRHVCGVAWRRAKAGFVPCLVRLVVVVAIAGYIWMACWQACIAINLWLSVVVQVCTNVEKRKCRAGIVIVLGELSDGHALGRQSARCWRRSVLCFCQWRPRSAFCRLPSALRDKTSATTGPATRGLCASCCSRRTPRTTGR